MRNISTYEMLDIIFDNIDHVVFVTNVDDLNFKVLHINDTFNTFGVPKDFLSQDPYIFFKKVIHPDDKRMLLKAFSNALKKKEPTEFDYRIIKPDQQIFWLYGKFVPVVESDGRVSHMVGISADVTHKKKEQIRLANLYKVQGDIIKMLAHDLRTPISGIKVLAESNLNSDASEMGESDLNRIVSNCQDTLLLMDDLLSYIQTDIEYIQLHPTELIVEQRIHFVVESFKKELIDKQLVVYTPSSETLFLLDPLRINQVLSNIISNAIKFSNAKGKIDIYLETTDLGLTINISDEGIGVPEDLQRNIFDVFTSSKRLGTHGEKSTGLGLSITKRLVELHAGTIELSSKEQKGTIVHLFFPNPLNHDNYDRRS